MEKDFTFIMPKKHEIILDKDLIYDTDCYKPFKLEDGSVDLSKEIFEFCIDAKDWKFEVEQQFIMRDICDVLALRYMILGVSKCIRHPYSIRVRALYMGNL